MKKILTVILALCCLLSLPGCSAKMVLKDISSTAKIEIYDYEADRTVEITDPKSIDRICENLLSLKLSKMHYNKPTISVYRLTFYDVSGNQTEVIGIPAHNWIRCNGAFYNVTEGTFDRDYIAELLKSNA